jgi:hypothetical protein
MHKIDTVALIAAIILFGGCTQTRNTATPMMAGGVHDVLTRVRPNVYSGNFQSGPGILVIQADLSARPKRLTVTTSQGGCKWAATA